MTDFAPNRPSRRGRGRGRQSGHDGLEFVPDPDSTGFYGGSTLVDSFTVGSGHPGTHSYNGKGRKTQKGHNTPNESKIYGAAGTVPPRSNGSGVFNGQAIGYHGSGAGAVYQAYQANTQPFTSAALRLQQQHPSNPFNNFPWPSQKQTKAQGYDFVRACFLDDHGKPMFDTTTKSDSFYLKYLSQISDGEREMHPVFRSRALEQLLDVGSAEQVCAEVFHFISGVLKYKYGDGYMRDDLTMCDCHGTVPVCFMRAYLDERERAEKFRQRAEHAEAQLREAGILTDAAIIL